MSEMRRTPRLVRQEEFDSGKYVLRGDAPAEGPWNLNHVVPTKKWVLSPEQWAASRWLFDGIQELAREEAEKNNP